jgi:protein O-mannosyl-transferase
MTIQLPGDCEAELTDKVRSWSYVFLCGLVALTFFPSLRNGFVDWDDLAFVVNNAHIAPLSLESVKWMITTNYQGVWHPLTWFSHALDRSLWGLNPAIHHLMSLLIHVLNVILFYKLFLRLLEIREESQEGFAFLSSGGKLVAAFFAALFFGVHPLRVESVVWISERKDVLSSFFYLAGVLAYLGYAAAGSRSAAVRAYLACLGLFCLALLSKPMAVTLPAVLLLMDYYPLERLSLSSARALLLEKVPFFALSATVALINIIAKGSLGVPLSHVPAHVRIMNAFDALIFYMRQTLAPIDLVPLYQLNPNLDYFGPKFVLCLILVVAITTACLLRAYKNDRLWIAVWAYYVITVFPGLGLYLPYRHAMADRYTYLTTLGFWVLLGLGAGRLWDRAGTSRHPSAAYLIFGLCFLTLLSTCEYKTSKQIGVWKDSGTLWTHVIEHSTHVPALAYLGVGKTLEKKGELNKALAYYQTALSISPHNYKYLKKIADVLSKAGKYTEALPLYRRILAKQPKNLRARADMARILGLMGRFDEAKRHLEEALRIDPDFRPATLMLMLVHIEKGDLEAAMDYYHRYTSKGFNVRPEIQRRLGIRTGTEKEQDELGGRQ